MRRWIAIGAAVAALVAGACSVNVKGNNQNVSGGDIPSGCTGVDVATSPEKFDLLTKLAEAFNRSDAAKNAKPCAFVRITKTSSGVGAQLLADGWPDPARDGPKPTVWSPAASSWGAILNQRLQAKGQPPMAPNDAKPFMVTPLVIAMPKPMADALGYPATPIGFGDLLALAKDPSGWASKGHPEWGPFKLGKTNPNFSTSGLSGTIAQYYAATGKQSDLTLEDINRPEVDAFMRGVESSVVHYGDITLTFLNNLYRNDRSGAGLTYVSAVAVEEKSIIDYNRGNPDGILDPGEQPRKPRVPLVAVYPKDGTLFSDSPFYVLDAKWVAAKEKAAARVFETFVQRPENQRSVLDFGFRPGNPSVAVADPIVAANGVDPAQPQTTLGVPAPEVLTKLLDKWGEQRKGAKVLLVIDVSGSMGEEVGGGDTKLDLAKRASIDALDEFKADDLVGLRIFSTDISPKEPKSYLDLVPIGPIGENREAISTRIASLTPTNGTPLYRTATASFEFMKAAFDPARINAVVLLTDGRNEDTFTDLNATLSSLRAGSEGQSTAPVRLFTIAYGQDADKATLKRLAEATNAAAYDASDPQTISKVFTAVVSNF
ncbi:MAG: Ca-activated chloride channel [Actinomycetota bacterium]|jgi:Ca-activated chloride channel family protein|nr:Ca-activated chloride channel [Actinomycetota bacterium]